MYLVALLNLSAIIGKSGKAKRAYLGIEDKVPVRVGITTARVTKTQYENLIFLKAHINPAINTPVTKNSNNALK